MRETDVMESLRNLSISFQTENLPLGDMVIRSSSGTDLLIFERKTFSDLLASIRDGRYQEQSMRLLNTGDVHSHNIIYLIERDSKCNKDLRTIRSAMVSLQYYKGFSVMQTISVKETAELLASFLDKLTREEKQNKKKPAFSERVDNNNMTTSHNYCSVVRRVKRDNITPNNISEIVLCQIPGVGEAVAIAVAKAYPTFTELVDALREKRVAALTDLRTSQSNGTQRRISTTVMKSIVTFLTAVAPDEVLIAEPRKSKTSKRKKEAKEEEGAPKVKAKKPRIYRRKSIDNTECLL